MLLPFLVFAPAIGAALVLVAPTATLMKRIALASTAIAFALSVAAALAFMQLPTGSDTHAFGPLLLFKSATPWIHAGDFRVNFTLGVDGLSVPFIVLSALISLLAVAASWNFESWKTSRGLKGYLVLLLLLETGILGVFTSLDFFLFYVFFEVMLVPMYFLIGVWGGPRKEYAAIKFFLYTLAGSVLLLIVMLALYFYAPVGIRTFDLLELARNEQIQAVFRDPNATFIGYAFAPAMFVLAFIAFAIKLPIVPFHTWLPDAHVEAPTPISMILAALLLKTGGYGLIRIGYSILPTAAEQFATALAVIGVVSILYGAFCTLAQRDLKRLVAYSSVSHMGYVVLGLAALTPTAVQGAVFQMIAHGISSAMCFFLVGVIYDRAHHRDIERLGGLWMNMPLYGSFASIGFFATMGLPTLCGFIGEVMVVLGTFQSRTGVLGAWAIPLGILAAAGAILAAAYVLWMMQRVYLGPRRPELDVLTDLNRREIAILLPLALLAIVLGILPQQSVLHFFATTILAAAKFTG